MAASRGQSERALPECESLEGETFSLLLGASVSPPVPLCQVAAFEGNFQKSKTRQNRSKILDALGVTA